MIMASVLSFHMNLMIPLFKEITLGSDMWSTENILMMDDLASVVEENKPLILSSLLARARDFKQSDGRDKIYALLGLISDPNLPKVDYTITPLQMYLRFSRYLVSVGQGKSVIFMAAREDRHPEHPSWVARWPPLLEHQSLGGWDDPGLWSGPQARVHLGNEDSTIIGQGTCLDKIKLAGPILSNSKKKTDSITCQDYLTWLQNSTDVIAHGNEELQRRTSNLTVSEIHENIADLLGTRDLIFPDGSRDDLVQSVDNYMGENQSTALSPLLHLLHQYKTEDLSTLIQNNELKFSNNGGLIVTAVWPGGMDLRRFCLTEGGLICLASGATEPEDWLYGFEGDDYAYILRDHFEQAPAKSLICWADIPTWNKEQVIEETRLNAKDILLR